MTFSVTGSATYLAASSLSDSSSIEANTYLRSLKPHVRAESLQSFQMIVCPGAQRNRGAEDASPSDSAISDDHVGFF